MRRVFAVFQDQRPQALASPIRMDEYRPDLGGFRGGIQYANFPMRPMIAAKQSLAIAPSSARDDQAGLRVWYGCEVCSIFDELSVQPQGVAERALNLRGRVIILLQEAHGAFDQNSQFADIRLSGPADLELLPNVIQTGLLPSRQRKGEQRRAGRNHDVLFAVQ